MQEPIVFNYSILENLLYGKLNATNTEVYNATTISNANEFIEAPGQIKEDEEENKTAAKYIERMEESK